MVTFYQLSKILLLTSAAFSFLVNIIFLFVFVRQPSKLFSSYKFVVAAFIFLDLIFSLVYTVAQPLCQTIGNSFICILTSDVGTSTSIAKILVILIIGTYVCLNFLVLGSFFGRYLIICRPSFFGLHYSNANAAFSILCASTGFYTTYLYNSLLGPSEYLEVTHREAAYDNYEVEDLQRSRYFGLSMNALKKQKHLFSIIYTCIVMSLMCITIVFFCLQIMRTLKKTLMQENRHIHAKMFRLLVYQCLFIAFFVYAPIILMFLIIYSDYDMGAEGSFVMTIGFASFPSFNPLFFMLYIKDYREYIKRFLLFGRSKHILTSATRRITTVSG